MSDEENKREDVMQEGTAKKPRRSLLKKILLTLGILLLGILVLLLAHPLWIGAVGRSVATSLTPSYTGTDFKLDGLSLNGYTGKLTVNGLSLGNPEGSPRELPEAVSVKSLFVDVEPLSLTSSDIHVREIRVESPHVSTFCIGNLNNFAVIGENVAKKMGPKKEKEEKPSDTKVGIDHLLVTDVRVDFGTVSALTIPKIELTTVTNVATLVVEGLRISNPPEETSITNAVYVGKVTVTMDWASLFTKTIHVHDITIEDPYVSAFTTDVVTPIESFNFNKCFSQVIPKKDENKKDEKADKKKDTGNAEGGVKVVIDRIALVHTKTRIAGIDIGHDRVKILRIPFPGIPDVIEIKDIGKTEDGTPKATASVDRIVTNEIWPKLRKTMGTGFNAAMEILCNMLDGMTFSDAVRELLARGCDIVEDLTKQVLNPGAGKVLGNTATAVTEGTTKAADAVGNAAKDGASKTLNAVKSLNPFGGK